MRLRTRWTIDLPAALFTAPLVGPVVTAPGTFEVGGIDPATGATRWRLQAGGVPRSFAWVVQTARALVACAGADRQWRIVGLDPAGATRFELSLEGWGSEAAALGDRTYVLSTREGPRGALWELDGAGALTRRWEVPAGAFSLSASGRQLVFAVRGAEGEGMYQVDLEGGALRRLASGWVERAECHGDLVLEQRRGGAVALRDREGTIAWETDRGGLTPHLADDGVYAAEPEGDVWAAVCRDARTGAVRWRHALPEADRYLEVFPWEDVVVLWDAGPLSFVDRRTGASLQTLEGDFTAVGPGGCGEGVLVVAAGETLHCIERCG